METVLRIALAQIDPTVGDLDGNVAKIESFIEQAKRLRADIITFPELAICGYPPEDLLLKEYFVRDNLNALHSFMKNIFGIIVIAGFVNRDNKGNIYNAAAIIQNGKLKGVYHKIELPNYGVFDEKRYFQSGDRPLVFVLGEILFGVNICEDIWKSKGVISLQADRGAKLLINISSSPYHLGKMILRKRMLIERAKDSKAYICYNNLVGGQDELLFDGGSLILDPKGRELIAGKQFEEDMVIADLPIDAIRTSKIKLKGKDFIHLDDIENHYKPKLPKNKHEKLNMASEVYQALVMGTSDYIRKNGFQKAVVGLSGGIDSSLTAVIACDAIGKDNVIGVSMPSRYSSQETQDDAKALAGNLEIKLITIPINSIFDVYLMALSKEFFGKNRDTTEENLQARIRGNILMSLSNKFGWLVLTTGNKSETSVGYCTLYGDTAGGFAVIKDAPKTLVYKLVEYRNKKAGRDIIPQSVILREPSAELRFNQKDRDSLPDYSILDNILKKYVEEDRSLKDIVSMTKFDPRIIKDVIQRVDRNEYKRRQAPPGIKITPKAFGKDRRLPITNRYKEGY